MCHFVNGAAKIDICNGSSRSKRKASERASKKKKKNEIIRYTSYRNIIIIVIIIWALLLSYMYLCWFSNGENYPIQWVVRLRWMADDVASAVTVYIYECVCIHIINSWTSMMYASHICSIDTHVIWYEWYTANGNNGFIWRTFVSPKV